jgi:hypothetical protein
MPCHVVDLMPSWMGSFCKSHHAGVWGAVTLCAMWVLWRERNLRVFEGQERTVLDLKLVLLRTLFDRLHCSSNHSFSSFKEFLDSSTLI